MRTKLASTWAEVARIAARQHGAVELRQLLWAGLSRSAVKRALAAGRLHRIHRGVYAVGHTNLSWKGKAMAAVLACGPEAALSHASAAHLWSLSPKCPPFIEVTVPTTAGRARREGIALHRSTTLGPRDVTRRHNIPVTTLARTKADMGWEKQTTRSELERKFFRLLRDHGLPLPEANQYVGPHEVDFLWRAEKLAVEVDSYAYHSDRRTFRTDRARDRYLTARGFTPMRFADEELDESPEAIAATLRAQLQDRPTWA